MKSALGHDGFLLSPSIFREFQACQKKFEEWCGSLRGRQDEVAAFSKEVGLSALQIEKRFHYIRKHYEKITKRLTVDDDTGRKFYESFASASAVFSMCPGEYRDVHVISFPAKGSIVYWFMIMFEYGLHFCESRSQNFVLSSSADDVQISLVQKIDHMAQHEIDSERLLKMLMRVGVKCRFNGEQVCILTIHFTIFQPLILFF